MTRIINHEQVEAHKEAARLRNPHLNRIESLRAQIKALSDEMSSLISDEEKYYNLLTFLSTDFDSRVAAVKVMTDAELADHLGELFFQHTKTEVDEAILMETLDRLGHAPSD